MKFSRELFPVTESDVKCHFYHKATKSGLEVHTEVRLPSEFHKSKEFTVDAIVVDQGEIICAVEFKRGDKSDPGEHTKQFKAYKALPCKTYFCIGKKQVDKLVRAIKTRVYRAGGKYCAKHQKIADDEMRPCSKRCLQSYGRR